MLTNEADATTLPIVNVLLCLMFASVFKLIFPSLSACCRPISGVPPRATMINGKPYTYANGAGSSGIRLART